MKGHKQRVIKMSEILSLILFSLFQAVKISWLASVTGTPKRSLPPHSYVSTRHRPLSETNIRMAPRCMNKWTYLMIFVPAFSVKADPKKKCESRDADKPQNCNTLITNPLELNRSAGASDSLLLSFTLIFRGLKRHSSLKLHLTSHLYSIVNYEEHEYTS